MKMIEVFEVEKKISENLFVVKFFDWDPYYLLQVLPLRIWVLENYERVSDSDLLDIAVTPENSIKDYNIGISPVPLFIVTNRCNIACDYCYADEGSYGYKRTSISNDIIDQTFNVLYKTYRESIKKYNILQFEVGAICFGGEPFLNVSGMRRILHNQNKIAQLLSTEFPNTQVEIRQHINTNGYIFSNDSLAYIRENSHFIEFVVSFDGINHDLHRKNAKKEPTSHSVIETIHNLINIGFEVSITCCIHPNELANFEENIKYLTDLFGKSINVNFSFLRGSLHFRDISAYGKRYVYDDSEILKAAYTIKRYLRAGYNIYSRKFSNLQERAYPYRCPAIGKSELCIMPDGGMYPCHNFVDANYSYGNILKMTQLIMQNHLFDSHVKRRDIFSQKDCRDCCMKSICLSSFDCPSHSLFDLNDINQIDHGICDFARIVQSELLLNTLR